MNNTDHSSSSIQPVLMNYGIVVVVRNTCLLINWLSSYVRAPRNYSWEGFQTSKIFINTPGTGSKAYGFLELSHPPSQNSTHHSYSRSVSTYTKISPKHISMSPSAEMKPTRKICSPNTPTTQTVIQPLYGSPLCVFEQIVLGTNRHPTTDSIN
jgi:hypothetical protein